MRHIKLSANVPTALVMVVHDSTMVGFFFMRTHVLHVINCYAMHMVIMLQTFSE